MSALPGSALAAKFVDESDLKRDAAYDQLLLDIICGEMRPGERLDEAGLAERYGSGRAGIRDALYRLSLEGLIERRPRLGTIVAAPSLIELQQVFHLRIQLEGQCAAFAARHARDFEIAAMLGSFSDAEAAIADADWRRLVQWDRGFHAAIGAAAHNQWLDRTVVTLHNSALRFWHYSLPRRPVAALHREIAYHRAVAEAIGRHDAAAAQAAMRNVLGEFPATVQDMFSDSPEDRM